MFQDREAAGRHLAAALQTYINNNTVIVALPRGGVPVGFEVAKAFQIPLYVLVVRKIGAPGQEEFGIGAIAENDVMILDRPTIYELQIPNEVLETTIRKEQKELERRVEEYRGGKQLPELSNKTVVVIDDGLATGASAKAAIESLRKLGVHKIMFATPVCAEQTANEIRQIVSSVLCLTEPHNLYSVGRYYENFEQTTDKQVIELLKLARKFGGEKPRTYH